jgi:Ca2+-binding RTX toxin-like protein
MKLAGLVAVLILLAIPSSASAGLAEVADGQFRYTAAPGERNSAEITLEGDEYHVTDNGPAGYPEIGPGCRTSDQPAGYNRGAYCPAAGVTSIAISLGDRRDALSIQPSITMPVTYSGGDGDDLVFYSPDLGAVQISADGKPDDGPLKHDDVRPDVETLLGTRYADVLTAGIGASALRGGGGPDTLAGGPGNDSIGAAYIEDVGLELGAFDARGVDRVSCGGGHDYVLADTRDTVSADCEVVARDRRRGNYAYEIRGSARRDDIRPREFFEGPVRILGLGGADTLRTNADDALFGGRGNDVLRPRGGVTRTANHLDGGRGNDRIYSRDDTRDFVRCGPGRHDRAFVDRLDRVMRDCELVSRRG